MDLGLKGKVAIVTGGAKGIGSGIVEALAQEGVNVVINYRSDKEKSEAFALKIAEKYSVETLALQGDVSVEGDIVKLFKDATEHFGTIDILINNAGVFPKGPSPIEEFDLNDYKIASSVNIEAVMISCREFVKLMKSQKKGGHIVNVLTKSVFWSSSINNNIYIASKGAGAAFTRGLAHEVAKDGIYVNAIIPGYVENSHTDPNSDRYKRTIEYIPMKRYALPIEMGYAVCFLCSEKSCQCNGAMLDCTGATMNGN